MACMDWGCSDHWSRLLQSISSRRFGTLQAQMSLEVPFPVSRSEGEPRSYSRTETELYRRITVAHATATSDDVDFIAVQGNTVTRDQTDWGLVLALPSSQMGQFVHGELSMGCFVHQQCQLWHCPISALLRLVHMYWQGMELDTESHCWWWNQRRADSAKAREDWAWHWHPLHFQPPVAGPLSDNWKCWTVHAGTHWTGDWDDLRAPRRDSWCTVSTEYGDDMHWAVRISLQSPCGHLVLTVSQGKTIDWTLMTCPIGCSLRHWELHPLELWMLLVGQLCHWPLMMMMMAGCDFGFTAPGTSHHCRASKAQMGDCTRPPTVKFFLVSWSETVWIVNWLVRTTVLGLSTVSSRHCVF